VATQAGTGLSQNTDAVRAAREAAGAALERIGGERADWGLVFATPGHRPQYAPLLAEVQKTLGTACLAGCSGAGVIGAGEEVEGGHGVAVLAVRSDVLRAETHLVPGGDDFGRQAALDLAGRLPADGSLLAFPDPFAVRPQIFLSELRSAGSRLAVLGGAPGGAPRHPATFQFFGRNVATRSIAALHLRGESARGVIGITQGCQPLGPPCRVTRGSENIVLELDGRPALDVLRRRLPAGVSETLERLGGHLFVGFPPDPAQEEIRSGEYLVRPLVAIDPGRGAILLAEDVRVGQPLLILLREGQAARDDLKAMLERFPAPAGDDGWRFGLYFNCAGRGSALYGIPGVDAAYIAQRFGDLPVAGFFGNAELAPLNDRNLLFTHTGVLALFAERGA
jgi:small ligand-binding sensory domain FIST